MHLVWAAKPTLDTGQDDWKGIELSNEFRFQLYPADGRIHVVQTPGNLPANRPPDDGFIIIRGVFI